MREFLGVVKALADQNRLRALLALMDRELCACQIIELLGLAPSTVSRHMSQLRGACLVDARKEGRWTYYRMAGEEAPREAREAIAWIRRSLSTTPEARRDAARLRKILRVRPEELCRRNGEMRG